VGGAPLGQVDELVGEGTKVDDQALLALQCIELVLSDRAVVHKERVLGVTQVDLQRLLLDIILIISNIVISPSNITEIPFWQRPQERLGSPGRD
jgi:hypothetical protein